jgi:tetratricopeptide (TPR) repeat protein
MNDVKTTGRLAAAACMGALLLACSGRQVTRHVAPMPDVGADGYYAIGRAEHVARRYDAAQRYWDAALRLDPGHVDARNGMAVLLAERGKYDQAIALWRTLVDGGKAQPPAAQAFLLGNLGYALYLRGDRDEAVTMLEKACVLDPYRPLAWEHLATVLEALGQTERALQMMKQARALQTHDIAQDYALTGARAPTREPAMAGLSPWPEGLARTELRQAGAVVEVHRVAAPAVPPPQAAPPTAAKGESANGSNGSGGNAGLRLEISNGNGAPGMAAQWKRRLAGPEWKSVRLTNEKPFSVPVTRIEYHGDTGAGVVARALAGRLGLAAPTALPDGAAVVARSDLRIVLGWDQRPAAAPADKEPARVAVQAP